MSETTLLETRTSAAEWEKLRDPGFRPTIESIIERSAPPGVRIASMVHVRTSHYVAYRVDAFKGSWLVRVGVTAPSDSAPANNSGPLGTSMTTPTGQNREYRLARGFASAGSSAVVPERCVAFDGHLDDHAGIDVLWLPFLEDSGTAVTAAQWAQALIPLHASRPAGRLPVFTNRAKTLGRMSLWEDREAAAEIGAAYDAAMARLFGVATAWGPVHGDAHSGNVLVSDGKAMLFDFDTACWAPLVWDLTHLLTRAGTDRNTGYTVGELREAFGFTDEEVDAAVELRLVARRVARWAGA